MKKRAAHYRGLAAGAQRMQQMGHKTASGGGGDKPPRSTCLPAVLLVVGGVGSVIFIGLQILQTLIG